MLKASPELLPLSYSSEPQKLIFLVRLNSDHSTSFPLPVMVILVICPETMEIYSRGEELSLYHRQDVLERLSLSANLLNGLHGGIKTNPALSALSEN
jgi:hypothetical protein